MAAESFTRELALRHRRVTLLSTLRLVLAVAYFLVQALKWPTTGEVIAPAAGFGFCVYSLALLLLRGNLKVRRSAYLILMIDLGAMMLLAPLGAAPDVGIGLLMFYFLITEAALLHTSREVLLLTSFCIAGYGALLAVGVEQTFQFSTSSFLFMIVVGGALGYHFAYQSGRIERRIESTLREAVGKSEERMVAAVEQALQELTVRMKCARTVLAFWNPAADYYAVCRYPPVRAADAAPPKEFEHHQEWIGLSTGKIDVLSNDLSSSDDAGKQFALHPYAVQRFEAYNLVSIALRDGDEIIGRLLAINSVKGFHAGDRDRLAAVAPHFREAIRHLLVVRRTKHWAQETERTRISHDLHDGPLQSIISFDMRLAIIRRLRESSPEQADQEFDHLTELSRTLVKDMRTFVHGMRPIEQDDSSLVASTRRLIDSFQKESGVAVTITGEQNGEMALPGTLGGEVLKIVREALHNIYKHSQASHVLFGMEKKDQSVQLSVNDNGKGYPFGGSYSLAELDALRIGPRSIKERVRTLGGTMTLESNPGHGSHLRVVVPLNGDSPS